jgi:hypothetical protein
MIVDTLIVKIDIDGDFIEEDKFYEITLDYSKSHQIISLEGGIQVQEDCEDFLKSIDGERINALYKGKSRIDDMSIFILSPLQINRQIKLDQIL